MTPYRVIFESPLELSAQGEFVGLIRVGSWKQRPSPSSTLSESSRARPRPLCHAQPFASTQSPAPVS